MGETAVRLGALAEIHQEFGTQTTHALTVRTRISFAVFTVFLEQA